METLDNFLMDYPALSVAAMVLCANIAAFAIVYVVFHWKDAIEKVRPWSSRIRERWQKIIPEPPRYWRDLQ